MAYVLACTWAAIGIVVYGIDYLAPERRATRGHAVAAFGWRHVLAVEASAAALGAALWPLLIPAVARRIRPSREGDPPVKTLYVPSPNFYPGRRSSLLWIVWHSTEGPERAGAAEAVARGWFALPRSGVSAHIVADDTTVVECVSPGNTAWHCANGNAAGYGIEIVGQAAQGRIAWRDPYSLAAVRNACAWIRRTPELAHIPPRWLSDDQLRARQPGHITHAQVSRVLGGTTHTDPGPDFPLDAVIAALGGAPAPAKEDDVAWTATEGAPPVPDYYRPGLPPLADPLQALAWATTHAANARDAAQYAVKLAQDNAAKLDQIIAALAQRS